MVGVAVVAAVAHSSEEGGEALVAVANNRGAVAHSSGEGGGAVATEEQQQVIARPTRRPRVKKTMALLDGNTNWIYLQLQNPTVDT